MPNRRAVRRAATAGPAAAVALAVVLAVVGAGCTSDGEGDPTTPPPADTTGGAPSTASPTSPVTATEPTPAASGPTDGGSSTVAAGGSTIQIDDTVPAPTAPPATDPPVTDPPVTDPPVTSAAGDTTTTLDARTLAADELAAALPDAEAAGMPPDWSVRDLQAGGDESSVPASELDPFRQVVRCPEGFVDLRRGGPWVERKFNGLDPSPEGVLIVRLQLVQESAGDWSERRRQLGACTPVSVDAFAERAPTTVELDGGERLPAARLAVFSSATGDSPFPSQVVYVTAHRGDVTAIVSFFGLNEAETFDAGALSLLADVLSAATG